MLEYLAAVMISLGLLAICVAFCTRDEENRRKPIMIASPPLRALGTRGARNNSHAYIEYDTPTYNRYIKDGWVVVGVEHAGLGIRDRIFAHMVKPTKVE